MAILPLPDFDADALEFDEDFLLPADDAVAATMRLELGVTRAADADFRELSLRPFLPDADEREAERAELADLFTLIKAEDSSSSTAADENGEA